MKFDWLNQPWAAPALLYGYWTNKIKELKERNDMTANIIETSNGFRLEDKSGLTIGTYSRRRDAVRGAARRGFTVTA